MRRRILDGPFGPMTLEEQDGALTELHWRGLAGTGEGSPLLEEAAAQLSAYFAGRRREFDLPLAPRGSSCLRAVWQAMAEIPYGETRSYGAIAQALGYSARFVGTACGRNPLPILLPCHRVLQSSGGFGGYSGKGGLVTKQALLRLEGALLL